MVPSQEATGEGVLPSDAVNQEREKAQSPKTRGSNKRCQWKESLG
jgi:hypothetical protein